jgi:hypothetical protein
MIGSGFDDDYTVMAISGHSSTGMLARYTHPSEAQKAAALTLFPWAQIGHTQGKKLRWAIQKRSKSRNY